MNHNWEYKKLGEVCNIYQPKTISTNMLVEDGAYLVYGANGVIGRFDQYNHKERELLMTCRGATCGEITISEPYSWINGNAMVIHPTDGSTHVDFLKYQLRAVDLSCVITGAAQPQITRQSLFPLFITVPPLAIQDQIVMELDRICEIIEKKKQQIKELNTLAQSLFYEMFGDPVTNNKGWDVKRLDEVGEIVTGSTPSTADSTNWDGTINWVTPAELNSQLYYGETQRKLTTKGAKGLTVMPCGTVLLSSRAPIGKLAISAQPMCCNQGFKNIVCRKSINNLFLYFYLLLTMDRIKEMGIGATFKEVSKRAISAYQTIVPPLPLQQSFAKKIEAIERQKELINQSIKETQTLFDSRMEHYFGN